MSNAFFLHHIFVIRFSPWLWFVHLHVFVCVQCFLLQTMLSFIVYDWDGRNASEDDFLGSAHILLSQVSTTFLVNAEPFLIFALCRMIHASSNAISPWDTIVQMWVKWTTSNWAVSTSLSSSGQLLLSWSQVISIPTTFYQSFMLFWNSIVPAASFAEGGTLASLASGIGSSDKSKSTFLTSAVSGFLHWCFCVCNGCPVFSKP